MNEMTRQWMIRTIRAVQFYEDGALEKMNDEDLRETFERLLDWIEG